MQRSDSSAESEKTNSVETHRDERLKKTKYEKCHIGQMNINNKAKSKYHMTILSIHTLSKDNFVAKANDFQTAL